MAVKKNPPVPESGGRFPFFLNDSQKCLKKFYLLHSIEKKVVVFTQKLNKKYTGSYLTSSTNFLQFYVFQQCLRKKLSG